MTELPAGEEPATTEEYREEWNSYVAGLGRLKLNLNSEQASVLADSMGQLKQLVDAAAENREGAGE